MRPLFHGVREGERLSVDEAARLAAELYGLSVTARPLPGEYDDNFHLTTDGGAELVLKVARVGQPREEIELQVAALAHLADRAPRLAMPRVVPPTAGSSIAAAADGRAVWMLSWVPGTTLAHVHPRSAELLTSLGRLLGSIDRALSDFEHPAARRALKWDLARAGWIREPLDAVADPARRSLVLRTLDRFESEVVPRLPGLRRGVLHGDANDHNVVVAAESHEALSVIDLGDLHQSATVFEPAVAAAYAMLGEPDPLAAAAAVVAGYHQILPLTEDEVTVLFPSIAMRLAVSVTNSAWRTAREPDDPYLAVSEQPAWQALEQLDGIDPRVALDTFRRACGEPKEAILAARRARFGSTLRLAYREPLQIVRGWKQFLYDETGRAYLDAFNNVAHVGHCHPRVVDAIARQAALLNTNTRYLHENLTRYAERLCALLPSPLSVCYFVNSASEANELALRLARAHTGREEVIVLDAAYHGHTTTLIEVSPYKFNGPGGTGKKPWVHVAPIPDDYRGPYRRDDPLAGPKYARHVEELARACSPAAFLCETLPSVGGQIVPPPGYLRAAFAAVRARGGVCIADEVQVGFGRLGSHFWGFSFQDAVPDIVVLGKPIANGHPMGAVVTTQEIAASFDTGMEFFSTFGGNPVSCAAALAVLDVLEDEDLPANAERVGAHLLAGLRDLVSRHPVAGDARGAGLFLGLELVRDRETREPAPSEADHVVNRLRDAGILTGTDGPHHNVIKIRPPLVFTREDADRLLTCLDETMGERCAS